MPRTARKISSSNIYHVVVKGADRQLYFEEKKDYKKYLDILTYYKNECNFELYAFCLMANHVHLLLKVGDTSISDIFRRINTTYAGWFNCKYNRTGFLQNGRFYSVPVENLSNLINVIHYIHFNPTQAGLEPSPGSSYKWSSYNDYMSSKKKLTDIKYPLEIIGSLNNFISLHQTKPKEDCLDIEKIRKRLPDDVAKEIIEEISSCKTIVEFQKLSISKRNKAIVLIHKKGVSIRQLNRLTGTPRGVIEREINKAKSPDKP